MFFVLQTGQYYYLNEAFVQISEDYTCHDWNYYPITDNMICAASYYGDMDKCYVRSL